MTNNIINAFLIFLLITLITLITLFIFLIFNKKKDNFNVENNINTKKPTFVKDLVSVIIPSYNRYKFLIHAIKSVQKQTYKNIEIIVINDCSTEKEYKNGELEKLDKVRVIHLPINLRKKYNVSAAQGKTRNEGIKIAKGEWISFLDDDDYWYPTKLEKQLRILKENQKIFMCSTNSNNGNGMYDENKNYKNVMHKNVPNIIKSENIKNDNLIINSSVILHKNIINKVGEFVLGKNEDYEYWKRALKHTDCYYINEPLIYYDDDHGGKQHYEN